MLAHLNEITVHQQESHFLEMFCRPLYSYSDCEYTRNISAIFKHHPWSHRACNASWSKETKLTGPQVACDRDLKQRIINSTIDRPSDNVWCRLNDVGIQRIFLKSQNFSKLKTTRAQLMLRWPSNIAQIELSLPSGGASI